MHDLAEVPRDQLDAALDGLRGRGDDQRLETVEGGVDVVSEVLLIGLEDALKGPCSRPSTWPRPWSC